MKAVFRTTLVCLVIVAATLLYGEVKDVATLKTEVQNNVADNTRMFLEPVVDTLDSVNPVTTLTTAISATDTTITHPTLDELARVGDRVVVDPYTTAAEARRVTSISASTVTVAAAFDSNHSIGTRLLILRAGRPVTPELFGAVGDGTTDDSVAIQAALDAGFKTIRIDGDYRASGLSLSASDTEVKGSGTVKLIDSSTDQELLNVTGNRNLLVGLTLRGNRDNPPAITTGSPLRIDGNDNLVAKCRFYDGHNTASSPSINTNADNVQVHGNRNTLRDCESYDATYACYRNDGDDNRYINCFARGSGVSNRSFNGTGGSDAYRNSLLVDGFNADLQMVIDLASENNPSLYEHLTITNTVIRGGHIKVAHARNVTISNTTVDGRAYKGVHTGSDGAATLTDASQSWETDELAGMQVMNITDGSSGEIASNTDTTVTLTSGLAGGTDNDFDNNDHYSIADVVGKEGLVLAERVHELRLYKSNFCGTNDASGAPVDDFQAGAKHRTMDLVRIDGCTFGDPSLDPGILRYDEGLHLAAFKFHMSNSLVHGFDVSALDVWPDTGDGVEEVGENTPPALAGTDNVWVVGTSPTGAWVGHDRALAWDSSAAGAWVFEEEGVAANLLLRPGMKVFNKNTSGGGTPAASGFYEYRNPTDGWVAVEDHQKSLRLENNLFVGFSSSTLNILKTGASSEYTDASQHTFAGNHIDNRGSGGAVNADGRFGIGTNDPEVLAHIKLSDAGTDPAWGLSNDPLIVESDANTFIQIFSPNNTHGNLGFSDPEARSVGRLSYRHDANRMDFFTSSTLQMSLTSSGDLGLGSTAAPTAGGGSVLFFGDNAGDPTMNTNTAGIYAKDVSGTVEMFAVDEADVATQISPHDPVTGEWIFYSENLRTGERIRIDVERFFREKFPEYVEDSNGP